MPTSTRIGCAAFMMMACLNVLSARAQIIIHVDDDAPAGGDGATWSSAFTHLQDALFNASGPAEIRIAQGTYHPDRDGSGNITPGDRTASFALVTGVALYGGYRGCPGGDCQTGDPDERDISIYESVFSGDLADDDQPDFVNIAENSYHVVRSKGADPTAVLSGVTIQGANGNGPPTHEFEHGGGMYNVDGSPTVIDCIFLDNVAEFGGGMYNRNGHSTITRCTFRGNLGVLGGGICNTLADPVITGCAFIGNKSDFRGGGMCNLGSDPTVINCTFTANTAVEGGGVLNSGSAPTFESCSFDNNTAVEVGGGLVNTDASPALMNCLFVGNSAQHGGGMYSREGIGGTITNCTFSQNRAAQNGGGIHIWRGSLWSLTNCVLWQNIDGLSAETGPFVDESAQAHIESGGFVVQHTCVEGLVAGGDFDDGTNIGDDPIFTTGPLGCLYLGQIATGATADSPCVDAGSDIAAALNLASVTTRRDEGVDTDIADMGYHYVVTGQQFVVGDFDRNNNLDDTDFRGWPACMSRPARPTEDLCCRIFDVDSDGDVDLRDHAAFQVAFDGP